MAIVVHVFFPRFIMNTSWNAVGQGQSEMMSLGSPAHQLCQGSGLAATFTQGNLGLSVVNLSSSESEPLGAFTLPMLALDLSLTLANF